MIEYDVLMLLACVAALLAGFVDAVVGGGGLVQVPALFILYPELAVPQVIGTNRFSSFVGTGVASYQYSRKIDIPWQLVAWTGIAAGTMSFAGANLSSMVSAQVLKPTILVLMTAIACYTYFRNQLGQHDTSQTQSRLHTASAVLVGATAGFYNGLVGPGTGSLLVFGLVSIVGFQFVKASGIAKIINVIADIASLVFFLSRGYVLFKLALPLMLCNVAGSYLGSKTALNRGNSFVRIFFLLVIFGLILRFGWDIYQSYL